jgi:hypothetical protein
MAIVAVFEDKRLIVNSDLISNHWNLNAQYFMQRISPRTLQFHELVCARQCVPKDAKG